LGHASWCMNHSVSRPGVPSRSDGDQVRASLAPRPTSARHFEIAVGLILTRAAVSLSSGRTGAIDAPRDGAWRQAPAAVRCGLLTVLLLGTITTPAQAQSPVELRSSLVTVVALQDEDVPSIAVPAGAATSAAPGTHHVGLSALGVYTDEPTLVPVGGGGVRVGGTTWAASAGAEILYAHQLFRPTEPKRSPHGGEFRSDRQISAPPGTGDRRNR